MEFLCRIKGLRSKTRVIRHSLLKFCKVLFQIGKERRDQVSKRHKLRL